MLTMQTNWTTLPQLLSSQFIQNPRAVQAFTEWKPLTVYSWSVGVQRELPWKFMADVAYVGNSNTNVSRNIPINSLTPAQLIDPANLDPTQNNTQLKGHRLPEALHGYGNINERRYFDDGLTYHSIQVGVTRRLSNGLSFSGAYTGTRRAGLQGWDWYRPMRTTTPGSHTAQGSRPHNLVFGYTYQIPAVSQHLGNKAIVAAFLDGWQISGTTMMQGGTRGGFTYAFTGAPTGDLTQGLGGSRVSLVCDPNLPRSERTFERQFKTECVRPPGPLTDPADTLYQGNSLGDEFIALGFVNHDLVLFKNFGMTGGRSIEFRRGGVQRVQYRPVHAGGHERAVQLRDRRADRPEFRPHDQRSCQLEPRRPIGSAVQVLGSGREHVGARVDAHRPGPFSFAARLLLADARWRAQPDARTESPSLRAGPAQRRSRRSRRTVPPVRRRTPA